MSESTRVAIIGTGHMGGAMVVRLRAAGYPVTIWNRTRERADDIAARTGATVAGTPREAAGTSDVVLVALANDAADLGAHEGRDGIVAGLRRGTAVVDTSTIDPRTTLRLAEMVRGAGGVHVDCPVSGSVSSVEAGTLAVLAGGEAVDIDQVRPVLDHLGKVFHIGPTGTGATMKVAINTLLIAINQGLSEAYVLAEAAGIDPATAYDVFLAGATGAPYLKYKRNVFEHPENAEVAFSLDLVHKDAGLVLALAERTGVPVPQAQANKAALAAALDDGYADRDISAIATHLRELRTRSSRG
ncbi:tartronate semialdehyde reductase [Asanoa ishikariensis]|uniref:3-hydroxyisobutyrate dehydrogenase n=1 Tax=Asanoa ishikariensis TaxID=137265 RepID=A0A1H3MZV8_9ACTN|nr:NAD(P)-dependent oxidoreductase [Asanoa ishikariensis]GIF68942.1 tartronate semialdehyde reductase [Asanoa ishikariensis]SDY82172.1 3-hydroxyisobutyrate dehydrogenase [Asanoa ishikariensis]